MPASTRPTIPTPAQLGRHRPTAIRIFRSRTCRSASSARSAWRPARRRRDRRQILDLRSAASRPACWQARRRAGVRRPRGADAQRASWRWAPAPRRALRRSARQRCCSRRRRRDARRTAASGRGLHAASAGRRRRLHRFLCRHPSRDQCRQAVPARQSAAAELQICAHRLSRPRVVGARFRRARSGGRTASANIPSAAEPELRPCERLDYELELGIWIGPGNARGTPIPIGEAAGAHRRAIACSTTGPRATCRRGNTSRSARSWRRVSQPRSPPGS